jgi:Trypsin-like peptidase domain
MSLRKSIIFFIGLCTSSFALAQKIDPIAVAVSNTRTEELDQNFSEVVVPITSMRISPSLKVSLTGKIGPALDVDAGFGTGFCLDPACSFIATNYHVAITTAAKKIEGEKVVQRYLATGPQDDAATPNFIPNFGVGAFATKRDLAILKLQRALPHHHGLNFSADELKIGQQVDIYGYPKGIINPFRRLTRFPAVFQGSTESDLLAFDYELPSDKSLRVAGSSGGIVVDRQTAKIVGILCGTTETTAVAVPVETLVEFLTKVQPFLAHQIFPAVKQISPLAADIYPKFEPIHFEELRHRPDESFEITQLRQKAQFLADGIRNFIAVQGYAWGSGNDTSDVEAAYEVRVVDGAQTFRSYPDGKQEFKEPLLPRRNAWVIPGDEWSQLPKMVGTELKLRIRQAPDVFVNERRVKVFQYYAGVEDDLCQFEPVQDFGFFARSRIVSVECYGEVWTDEQWNIIRMSKRFDLSKGSKAYRGWQNCYVVLTYNWLKRPNELSRLVPLTIYTEARDNKHVYWCRGTFTDYRIFSVGVRLALD